MQTLYTIIGLFSLAALLGMFLLSFVLRNQKTPKIVAFIHGPLAIIALILLINYSTDHGPGLTESIVLFTMAALGGIILIIRDVTGRSVPKWLAVAHGLIAITGFIFLLVYAL